jgi:hypothetical protein
VRGRNLVILDRSGGRRIGKEVGRGISIVYPSLGFLLGFEDFEGRRGGRGVGVGGGAGRLVDGCL